MSYRLTSRRRPAPRKTSLEGFWGDLFSGVVPGSGVSINISEEQRAAEERAAAKAVRDAEAAAAAKIEAARIAAAHGGIAPAPGMSFTDAINSLKTMASSGRGTGPSPMLLVGVAAVGLGGYFWWRSRRK